MAKAPSGFVPLDALKGALSSTRDILADIRRIYFKTTRQTIEGDFAHAIELLKRLGSEEERERATAYMHGLAELRREWRGKGERGKGEGGRGKEGRGKKK
jgi:hypothetical protein